MQGCVLNARPIAKALDLKGMSNKRRVQFRKQNADQIPSKFLNLSAKSDD